MRHHLIIHRFVASGPAQTRVPTRAAFDVAMARKMLRDGATLEECGKAQGLSKQTVRNRLKALGLSYLINDRARVHQMRNPKRNVA